MIVRKKKKESELKAEFHHFMQSVEFAVAFLNSMLSAVHQHVNFKDLKEKKISQLSDSFSWKFLRSTHTLSSDMSALIPQQEETSGCCDRKNKLICQNYC